MRHSRLTVLAKTHSMCLSALLLRQVRGDGQRPRLMLISLALCSLLNPRVSTATLLVSRGIASSCRASDSTVGAVAAAGCGEEEGAEAGANVIPAEQDKDSFDPTSHRDSTMPIEAGKVRGCSCVVWLGRKPTFDGPAC